MQAEVPVAHAVPRREPETASEKYLRQIRGWVAFMGIVLILTLVSGVVAGIVIAQHASHPSSACLSQGGSDPSC